MSRADDLREAVEAASEQEVLGNGLDPMTVYADPEAVLRALVDHGGLSWEMVREMRTVYRHHGPVSEEEHAATGIDILATILEAAGVEEGA